MPTIAPEVGLTDWFATLETPFAQVDNAAMEWLRLRGDIRVPGQEILALPRALAEDQ